MTEAYLYKWTEKSTGMWYIGSRTKKNCHVNDGYICSSSLVKEKILQHPENWHRKILKIGNPIYIRNLESRFLKFLNAAYNDNSYNKSHADGKFHTIGQDPWNKGINTGVIPWNKGLPSKYQPFYKKTFTEETKNKLSQTQQGLNNSMYGKEPWNKGVKGKRWYNNGIKSVQYFPNEVPNGFVLGRIYTKRWYTNGKRSIQCIPGTEPNGYKLGRTIKHNMSYNKSLYKWFNNSYQEKKFKPGTEPCNYVPGRLKQSNKLCDTL